MNEANENGATDKPNVGDQWRDTDGVETNGVVVAVTDEFVVWRCANGEENSNYIKCGEVVKRSDGNEGNNADDQAIDSTGRLIAVGDIACECGDYPEYHGRVERIEGGTIWIKDISHFMVSTRPAKECFSFPPSEFGWYAKPTASGDVLADAVLHLRSAYKCAMSFTTQDHERIENASAIAKAIRVLAGDVQQLQRDDLFEAAVNEASRELDEQEKQAA